MNVLAFYKDRMETVRFRDKEDKALILRRGKSMAPKTIADGRVLVTDLDTELANGDIVERKNGERFVIVARQQSADCVQAQGRRINGYVDVIKFKDKVENHRKVGTEAITVAESIPVCFADITAAMRQYDAGLLQTTVKKIIIQPATPIALLDRIRLNNRNYQVVNIDTAKYVGLLELQVSEDNRK